MKTIFEWDAGKAIRNVRKHGISFETAVAVFSDPFVLTTFERVENGELRWQTFGMVGSHVLVMVAHTTWEEDQSGQTVEVIRIISAREADRKERKRYEEDNRQVRSGFGQPPATDAKTER